MQKEKILVTSEKEKDTEIENLVDLKMQIKAKKSTTIKESQRMKVKISLNNKTIADKKEIEGCKEKTNKRRMLPRMV